MTRANGNHTVLRIGELTKRLGTTTKTLRHYERMGLIEPSGRTSNGYRVYDQRDQRCAERLQYCSVGVRLPRCRIAPTRSPILRGLWLTDVE